MDIKSAIVVKCGLQAEERVPFSELIAGYLLFFYVSEPAWKTNLTK